jgi:hypothetical protein
MFSVLWTAAYLQIPPSDEISSHVIGRNVSFQFKVKLIDALYSDMSSRSMYK